MRFFPFCNMQEVYFVIKFVIQHWFICRPSDSSVSEDAGIEPMTVATFAMAVRRSNPSPIDLLHFIIFTQ